MLALVHLHLLWKSESVLLLHLIMSRHYTEALCRTGQKMCKLSLPMPVFILTLVAIRGGYGKNWSPWYSLDGVPVVYRPSLHLLDGCLLYSPCKNVSKCWWWYPRDDIPVVFIAPLHPLDGIVFYYCCRNYKMYWWTLNRCDIHWKAVL